MAQSKGPITAAYWQALQWAKCTKVPHPRHNLAGYVKGERYKAERRFGGGGYFFRIWPSAREEDRIYYDTLSERTFKRYFE